MHALGEDFYLFYYSNTLEVTREDQMKKTTTLGIPTHRVSRRNPGKLKVID